MYAISKYINGICLNPREYVLDGPDGKVMLFSNKDKAVKFLTAQGISNHNGIYIEPYMGGK